MWVCKVEASVINGNIRKRFTTTAVKKFRILIALGYLWGGRTCRGLVLLFSVCPTSLQDPLFWYCDATFFDPALDQGRISYYHALVQRSRPTLFRNYLEVNGYLASAVFFLTNNGPYRWSFFPLPKIWNFYVAALSEEDRLTLVMRPRPLGRVTRSFPASGRSGWDGDRIGPVDDADIEIRRRHSSSAVKRHVHTHRLLRKQCVRRTGWIAAPSHLVLFTLDGVRYRERTH